MFKPNLRIFGMTLVLTIATAGALFHGPSVSAETPSATPTESLSATASPQPTEAPKPTPTPIPQVFNFNRDQYNLELATSPWVVVNKQTPLSPKSYKPAGLIKPRFDNTAAHNPSGQLLARSAANAVVRMARDMKAEGAGTLILQSAYRSFASQTAVHARQVARLGLAKGEALAARPGFSEHQTGLAADVAAAGQGCLIQTCFSKTVAGKWLAQNAYRYGFILRYPKGKTHITGYQFEPWHFRFVGVSLATEMKIEHQPVLELFWKYPYAPNYLK